MNPCALCPKVRNPVPGDGPIPARIMAVGQYPGRDEDTKGRCWIGRTGKETNETYLPMAGLNRADIYMSNVIKCWPRNDRDATDEIAYECARTHLRAEIFAVKPEIIILLGAVACSLADISLDMHHDRPRMGQILGWECIIWPMFHPAQGLHDYAAMNNIMDGWVDFGRWLKGEDLPVPVDLIADPYYEELRTADEVMDIVMQYEEDQPLAMDTEYDPLPVGVDPYCLTFSAQEGTGFLIMADKPEALAAFGGVVGVHDPRLLSPSLRSALAAKRRVPGRGWRGRLLLHNATADLPPLATMGIGLDDHLVEDTMILAYNLCTLRQGLKILAWRLAGMEMIEFDDLVTPYAVEYWVGYMEVLADHNWIKPEPYMRVVPEKVDVLSPNGIVIGKQTQMVEKLYKPQGLNTKVKRLLTDYRKAPGPKVFKRWWESWDDTEKADAIKLYGDLPRKSIRMVTDKKALLGYACRDADATLRIRPILRRLRREFRRKFHV